MNAYYEPSELIINADHSIFHLHLKPEQLGEKVILVGDPGRVDRIARHFQTVECEVSNREFHTVTGTYEGKRISALSTGIGCDNIDIVLNEIDALTNIDFNTRQPKNRMRSLDIVRIGTCGGLQPDTPEGAFICSVKSIGLDGLLNFYAGRNNVCDTALEKAFVSHMGWEGHVGNLHPYAAIANPELSARLCTEEVVKGITLSANGFYGPQGRALRIPLADPEQNRKIEQFRFEQLQITNFEMESSAVAGLSALLGHRATTLCMVIANRRAHKVQTDYNERMNQLIEHVLKRI